MMSSLNLVLFQFSVSVKKIYNKTHEEHKIENIQNIKREKFSIKTKTTIYPKALQSRKYIREQKNQVRQN